MAVAAGKKLGPYEIVSLLGAGGMGEVYRARDPRLGREVAVKVLPAALTQDADRLRRFEQEARAVGSLNHPNILVVYDVGESEGSPYIVSELLTGETLREKLREGGLSPRKAAEYGAQIARGLAAAHDQGIVHRDLKPENLFLTRDGRVKILDFGLAKLTQPEAVGSQLSSAPTVALKTEAGAVMGTVGYMSPEQVRGKTPDPRSDLFALGAILYEMVSGQRAFKGDTPADTTSAILKEDPQDLASSVRNLPPGLERVIRHCLEKNPEERFQSARDVAFNLEALSGSTGTSALRAEPEARRGWRYWPLAVAVALLAVGGSLGMFLARPGGSATRYHRLTFRRGTVYAGRFAPDGRSVIYAAEWDGKPVQMFSVDAGRPVSSMLELPKACLLAISPSGELAMLLNPSRQPHQFCRGTLARGPMGGGAPREVLEDVEWADWSKDGNSLTIVRHLGGKDRLEFPIGKVLVETPGWLTHPRFSPDGKRIAFLEHPEWPDDRGWVAVVDLDGHKTKLTGEYISADGIAWTPDDKEIWFAAAVVGSTRALAAVSLDSKVRTIAAVPGNLRIHDISPKGEALISRDEIRNSMQALEPGATQETNLSWMDWSLAKDISPDGKTVLFDEEGDGGGPLYTVYLRATNGAPPIRLGEGYADALSPDGKWVLSSSPSSPPKLTLYPTGPGEAHPLPLAGIDALNGSDIYPDGKRAIVCGSEPGRAARCFIVNVDGGKPVAVTPEGFVGTLGHSISPDGKWFAVADPHGQPHVFPLPGPGEGRPLPGTTPGDDVIRWAPDSRSVYVYRPREHPAKIFRVDVATGKRELWKQIVIPDTTGLVGVTWLQITPDGKSYVYSLARAISDLYVLEGAK